MIEALYVSATGMSAQQVQLETTANNLANLNTAGFKRSQAIFEDLLSRETVRNEFNPLAEKQSLSLGMGTRVAQVNKLFIQGDLKATESLMDVAINGAGWVEVIQEDNTPAFSRLGTLKVNDDGFLALNNGSPLNPLISIPHGTKEIVITKQGKIIANVDNDKIDVGQLELALFPNQGGLKYLGENLYAVTEQSGDAVFRQPGEEGRGVVAQMMLEGSNVKLADELVSIMMAQRAFEAGARVLQAADEMLSISNNLRKS